MLRELSVEMNSWLGAYSNLASSPKRTLGLSMLRTGFPTKQTYERRIILLYLAAKTHQHQLPLSVGHVPLCKAIHRCH
jgi:hypothetical protein